MTTPRRRWFRFGLRTVFVMVGVLALPLGWSACQFQVVRQRQAAIVQSAASGVTFVQKDVWQQFSRDSGPAVSPVAKLRSFVFRDPLVGVFIVPARDYDRMKTSLSGLFPESIFVPSYSEDSPATSTDEP